MVDSSSQDPTDEVLASRIAAGDHEALRILVERWEAPLRRYVLRRCFRCAGEVEDLVQETFLSVYRHINDFDVELRFSSWIYRIAHNRMISQVRRRSFQADHVPLDEAGILVPDGLRTEAPLEAAELDREIGIVLEGMKPALRDVFVLRFLEEKSYGEIGDILHRNANTVATQVRRARENFATAARARGLHLDRED